jgi:UDP-N-acetylmuramate--alanine ligase
MVTEADEYDRSFLQLSPYLSIITSIDADHLDIYADEDDIISTYKAFANKTSSKGVLYAKESTFDGFGLLSKFQKKTYGLDSQAWINSSNLRVSNGIFHFDLTVDGKLHENWSCGLPGIHNIENATAAIAIALELGVDIDQLKESLAKFNGVKRRFDVHLKTNDFVYIDDYAHHPQEIKALVRSVRELYPGKNITAVFQPHLYSRTQDFGDEFGEELSKIDDLILLDLYPAREEPIEGIDSRWLAKKIKKENVHVCSKGLLMNVLKSKKIEVLLTIGAGDIDTMVDPIISYYE